MVERTDAIRRFWARFRVDGLRPLPGRYCPRRFVPASYLPVRCERAMSQLPASVCCRVVTRRRERGEYAACEPPHTDPMTSASSSRIPVSSSAPWQDEARIGRDAPLGTNDLVQAVGRNAPFRRPIDIPRANFRRDPLLSLHELTNSPIHQLATSVLPGAGIEPARLSRDPGF